MIVDLVKQIALNDRRHSVVFTYCCGMLFTIYCSIGWECLFCILFFFLITGFARKYDLLLHGFKVLVSVVKLMFCRNGTLTLCKPSWVINVRYDISVLEIPDVTFIVSIKPDGWRVLILFVFYGPQINSRIAQLPNVETWWQLSGKSLFRLAGIIATLARTILIRTRIRSAWLWFNMKIYVPSISIIKMKLSWNILILIMGISYANEMIYLYWKGPSS